MGKLYSSHGVDLLSRFPGLDWNASFENLHRYYLRRVSIGLDSGSSVSVLTVHAYVAADAQKINDLLLQMAERLVNTLNDRSRHDLIRFAEQDVNIAADKAKDAAVALFEYRSKIQCSSRTSKRRFSSRASLSCTTSWCKRKHSLSQFRSSLPLIRRFRR